MSSKAKTSQIKRGRTGSDLPPVMAQTERGLASPSREDAAHSAQRPKRVPMSQAKSLEVGRGAMEKGYYYRWVDAVKVAKAQAAYYEHVIDEQGNNIRRPSGPTELFLMKLEEKYRKEDLALKKQNSSAMVESERNKIESDKDLPDDRECEYNTYTSDSPYK